MKRTDWFDRKFPQIQDNGLLPGLIERLEGTPARLLFKLKTIAETDAFKSEAHPWSMKTELGHLIDLEPLWYERLKEIKAAKPELLAADLTNRKTFEAGHDQHTFEDLIQSFAGERMKLVKSFRSLTEAEMQNASLHPRLKTRMRAIDLAYFVAEHDDHHLARIQALMEEARLV